MTPLRASVVVPAYNEERNIQLLLGSLRAQKLATSKVSEIVVVASGCTDRTHDEVRAAARKDKRIRLLVQDVRQGKASAINAYLRERDPKAQVLVICSADIRLQPGCLELLVRDFASNPRLGMTGGRAVPVNPRGTWMGNIVNFLWELHHERAQQSPKLGEIVAVRSSLLDALPEQTPVDEANVEAIVTRQGYELRYVGGAVFANAGPDNLVEYFEQRRRIAAGHFWVREKTGYTVSTMSATPLIRLALQHLTFTDVKTDASYVAAAAIEAAARAAGYLDVRRKFSHAIWKIASSSHRALDNVTPLERPDADAEDEEQDGDAATGA